MIMNIIAITIIMYSFYDDLLIDMTVVMMMMMLLLMMIRIIITDDLPHLPLFCQVPHFLNTNS